MVLLRKYKDFRNLSDARTGRAFRGGGHNAFVSTKLRTRELRGPSEILEEHRRARCRLPVLSCQHRRALKGLLMRTWACFGEPMLPQVYLNLREHPCADGAGELVGAPQRTVSTMEHLGQHIWIDSGCVTPRPSRSYFELASACLCFPPRP